MTSRVDACLRDSCLVCAQMVVADEVKRREKLLGLDCVSFLEALARITCLKPLPSNDYIKAQGASTVVECIDGMISAHQYVEWCTHNAPQCMIEHREGRHLDEALDKLLQLIIARFDTEGNGVVSAKSFKNIARVPAKL